MLKAFASRVLSGPSDLRVATAELPQRTVHACWRLLDLLESISDRSRISCNKSTTRHVAIGVALLLSKSWPRLQRFWRLMLTRGWRNKPSGRYICQPRDTFCGLCLMKTWLMVSIRQIFCICHTIVSAAELTSMRWLLAMLSVFIWKLSLWLIKVVEALGRVYKRGPLIWPHRLQVVPGHEFMGAVNQLLARHNVKVRCGRVNTHRAS